MIDLLQEEKEVTKIVSRIDFLTTSKAEEEKALSKANTRLLQTQDAQKILQLIAQVIQQRAHEKMAEVVSSCLSSVFGEDAYQFKIEFERKRGRTEASLRFVRDELNVDPLTASGGGVIDVAAFALRVACLMLHRPKLSKVVVLDEPFRFVSAQYQDNVRTMLEELTRDLKMQIVMVSHNENLATGEIIEL